jgi:hypothetical protein
MWKIFTQDGNQKWFKILPEVVDRYNNKVHSIIGMTPTEASNDSWKIQKLSKDIMFMNDRIKRKGKPKLKFGEYYMYS